MTVSRIVIGALILIAVVILLSVVGPAACNSYFGQKKQIEVTKGQSGATADSASEAMNTTASIDRSDRQTDTTTKEAIDDVRKAPPGHSNDAALRAACKLRHGNSDKRCAPMRKADPAKPPPAR